MPHCTRAHFDDEAQMRRPLPAVTALVLVMLVLAAGSGATFAAGWDRVPWGEPRQSEPLKPLPAREGRQPDRSRLGDVTRGLWFWKHDRAHRAGASFDVALGLANRAPGAPVRAPHSSLELDDSTLALPPPTA